MRAPLIGMDWTTNSFLHPINARTAFTRSHYEIVSNATRATVAKTETALVTVAKTETALAGWQYDMRWTFLDALERAGKNTDRTEL